MIKLILRLFDLFAPLIRALDVDYPQFRAILETKLLLDTRRRSAMMQAESGRKRKPPNVFAAMLIFNTFIGFMLAASIATASPVAGAAMVHSFVMVMVGLSLVADFSTILLDTTDNAVLQPRPVTGRTILVARTAHILVYLAVLSLSLSLLPIIVETAKVGFLFPLVYLATLACSVALVVFLANLLYLLAMRTMSGERFRDLILYLQIGMTVVMMGAFQLLPRLMDFTVLRGWRLGGHAWQLYLLPPVWMAAPIDLLAGHVGALQIGLTILAVVVPLVGVLIVVFALAPRFSQALLKLDAGPAAGDTKVAKGLPARPGLGSSLGRLLCRGSTERASFELMWILCGRDRQFKRRTYPSLAIGLVIGLSFLLSLGHNQGIIESLRIASQTKADLYVLYMTCFMIASTLLQLRFSEHYQAAWVYEALPISSPGEVMIAALKAVLVRFVLPAYMIVSLFVAAIWGRACAWDLVFALGAILFVSTLEATYLARVLPFSEAYAAAEGSSRVAKSMGLMILPAAIGGFHYFLGSNRLALLLGLAVLLACTWLLARRYERTSWDELRQAQA